MKEKIYVDRLFAEYEATPELEDFKEEIVTNFKERVKSLMSSGGFDEGEAFEKAAEELGDITAIADEIGKKKRNETIGLMYMKARTPLTKKTAAGLASASGIFLIGIGVALINAFSGSPAALQFYITAVLISLAGGLYVFFGLTQETSAHYAMKSGRALAYSIVCFMGFLSAGLAIVSFLFDGFELSDSLIMKAILIIPALCALIFLLATESKRQKPWLRAMVEREISESIQFNLDITDPVKAAKFGVTSGGLWILALALFLTLHLYVALPFAWIIFIFAFAVQSFMVSTIFTNKK